MIDAETKFKHEYNAQTWKFDYIQELVPFMYELYGSGLYLAVLFIETQPIAEQ